ncbi:MAG TPA: hypothetical protein VJ723_01295 [Candidatus Angelobacter sp.]|nr:hypothetical protein [Candidatus Angelobacter sp.]
MLTPLATIMGALIGVYLKTNPNISWWIVGGLLGGLILSAVLASYFTHIRPARDASTVGRLLLDHIGTRIVKYCDEKGIAVRLNVLVVYRPLRFLFLMRRFKVRWSLEMHHADGGADFGIRKGVAGRVFATGVNLAIDMENPNNQGVWKFTERDCRRLKFPSHTLIWSFPVCELNKENYITGRVLGTLNLDSLEPNAFNILVADQAVRNEVELMMQELQDVVSKVASF